VGIPHLIWVIPCAPGGTWCHCGAFGWPWRGCRRFSEKVKKESITQTCRWWNKSLFAKGSRGSIELASKNNPNTLGVGMCTKYHIVVAVPSVLKTAIIKRSN
jgi:hypothetical protein